MKKAWSATRPTPRTVEPRSTRVEPTRAGLLLAFSPRVSGSPPPTPPLTSSALSVSAGSHRSASAAGPPTRRCPLPCASWWPVSPTATPAASCGRPNPPSSDSSASGNRTTPSGKSTAPTSSSPKSRATPISPPPAHRARRRRGDVFRSRHAGHRRRVMASALRAQGRRALRRKRLRRDHHRHRLDRPPRENSTPSPHGQSGTPCAPGLVRHHRPRRPRSRRGPELARQHSQHDANPRSRPPLRRRGPHD